MVFENKKTSLHNSFAYLLFTTQNEKQLSEEAAAACQLSGIDPQSVCARVKTGDAQRDAIEEKKRQSLINIVG